MPSHAACCCDPAGCVDCIWGDVIDASAGCCHSRPEKLCFKIERPVWSRFSHQFGDNPSGNPVECPGGCELASTTDFAAMDPIQGIYEYESRYFRFDFAAKEGDRPARFDPCVDVGGCVDCCPDTFPPFTGCVCDLDALLSPYQKTVMEATAQYRWLVEIICHGGSDCFPPRRSLTDCEEIPGDTTLYGQLLGVVHMEHWWKLSRCSGAVSPALHAPNDAGTPVQHDCILPQRWIYACSGAALFDFDLRDAVAHAILTAEESCAVLQAIGLGQTPLQGTLQKLWDAGYIRVKDWRPEIVAELAELKAEFPTEYAGCTVPACGALAFVGAVRKRWDPDCLMASEVADVAEALQPVLGACGVAPIDDDFWRDRQFVYFHARPGGWSYVCADSGSRSIPDLPRAFSVDCPGGDCLDVSGYPQDYACTPGPYDGVNPDSGLATCEVDGCSEETNPYGCIFPDITCATAGDGSECINVAYAASCDGMHFTYTEVQTRSHEVDVIHPAGIEWFCMRKNHAYLFGLDRQCGDWDSVACYSCKSLAVPLAVADLVPDVSGAYRHHQEMCVQVFLGADPGTLCCGGYCHSDPFDFCSATFDSSDCVAAPSLEIYAEQADCLP